MSYQFVKARTIHLVNYCGYEDTTFDLSDGDDVAPIVTFFGPNGIGKSQVADTFVLANGGMTTIGSLFDRSSLPKNEGWVNLPEPIRMGINGDENICRRLYYSGRKRSLKVMTECGFKLTGSFDRHIVLSPDSGAVEFKRFKDMKPGDKVAISRKSPFPYNCRVSEEEAMLLGYLISEGACAQTYGVQFTNTDSDVLQHYDILHQNVLGEMPYTFEVQSCVRKNTSQAKRHELDNLGLTRVLSGDKTVPESVLAGTKDVVCAFLRTYFEGDGGIEKSIQGVSCASKSYQLMHEIHLLLLRLGIVSSLRVKHVNKLSYVDKPYTSWRITIQGEEVARFAREIGFVSTRKKQELDDLISEMAATDRNPNRDIIPVELFRPVAKALKQFRDDAGIEFTRKDYKNTLNGLHCLQENYLKTVKLGVSRKKIEECVNTINQKVRSLNLAPGGVCVAEEIDLDQMTGGLWSENYFFDQVAEITEGEEELFDLEVEDAHRYWTNGFISHNTTGMRALQMAANPVMFRGRERSCDVVLRKSIHDVEYIPTVDMVKTAEKNAMLIDVDFQTDQGIKKVQIDNLGLVVNELGYDDCPINGWSYFSDADNPQNTQRFLLAFNQAQTFLTFAEEVYGYECELGGAVNERGCKGYTDFVIKKGKTKVHFKSMSAGEKKIATLVSDLCQPTNTVGRDIVLIDNVEMHVYLKRHARLIDQLRTLFPTKQIITTTHSQFVIDHIEPKYRFDLEEYRPDYRLMEFTAEERLSRYDKWMSGQQGVDHTPVSFGTFIQSDRLAQIAAKATSVEEPSNG